jgi:hypothetical protein
MSDCFWEPGLNKSIFHKEIIDSKKKSKMKKLKLEKEIKCVLVDSNQ